MSLLSLAAGSSARADEAHLWCPEDDRDVFGKQAASTFNPAEFVLPKEPADKSTAQGSVDVMVMLEADGRVLFACVLESDPKGVFEQVAADAVRQWRYAPADVATLPPGDRRMKVHVGFAVK